MDPATASIIVAAIAAIGSIVGIMVNKLKTEVISTKSETSSMRKESREDHAMVSTLLNLIVRDVHKMGEKIDSHIEDHHKNS
jgi:hypothetical protein